MGLAISKALAGLFSKEEKRILMVGLDAAGKTTVLYNLKLGEVVTTVPTIGFNVESLDYKNISFSVWDVGGQASIRRLWRRYYEGSHAVIFVVDSSDRGRIEEAKAELMSMMEADELRAAVLLIFANKQDLPGALTPAEITDRLGLRDLRQKWYIQACCAVEGSGLADGLNWLSNNVG